MDLLKPSEVELPRTLEDDPRVGSLIQRGARLQESARFALIGFPSDAGVVKNQGRAGAAQGPDALRRALFRMTPDPHVYAAHLEVLRATQDLGNITCTGDVAEDQQRLGLVVKDCLEASVCPIILGGGHEATYGHFLGYVQSNRPVSLVNFDAHADVRQGGPHSGSSFRQALEHPSKLCVGYHVAGLNPCSVALAHLEFVAEHGTFCFADELDGQEIHSIIKSAEESALVTLDLDAVHGAEAPGVSAPCPFGMSAELWLRAAREAGLSETVTSLDVVELNPAFDCEGRTASLAALGVWTFLAARATLLK